MIWSEGSLMAPISKNDDGYQFARTKSTWKPNFAQIGGFFVFWRPFWIQYGHNSKPKWSPYGAAWFTPCKHPFPLKSFHFWIFNNLFLFLKFLYWQPFSNGGHFALLIPIFLAYLVSLDVDVTGNITAKIVGVWSEFNIFCTLVTMAMAAILNFCNPPKRNPKIF